MGKTPILRATGPTVTPPTEAPVSPEPQTSTSHEHLLDLLSKMDALPQLRTIQWIPRGLDRRYAAVPPQALDRAMQAGKANTAAPNQSYGAKCPHHSPPDSPSGTWPQTARGRGLAEKGDLEQLLKGAIEDQEKQKQSERRSEGPGETDKENDRLLRAAQAVDRGQLRTATRLLRGSKTPPANGSDG